VTDAISRAVDEVLTQQAVEPTTIEINGEKLPVDKALEKVRLIAAQVTQIEPFDHTKPRLIQPVPIDIGGKTRHLRLPFWALRRFQQMTGLSPWDHEKVWAIPADLDITVTMLWVALLDENPDLTLDEVWRFEGMDFANIHYIRFCLDECWGRNMPAPDSSDEAQAAAPNSPSRRRTG
jgi:hypothetical protein